MSSSATDAEDKWRKAQREDSDLAPLVRWLEAGQVRPSREEVAQESPATKHLVDQWETLRVDERGVLVKQWVAAGGGRDVWLVIVPRASRVELLTKLHAGVTSGHLGEKKTLCRLRQRFYWVGMRSDVTEWCRACDVCSAKKGPARKTRAPLQLYCVDGASGSRYSRPTASQTARQSLHLCGDGLFYEMARDLRSP